MPISRLRAAIPALIFTAILTLLTTPPKMSGNVWSRYMTIEAIVERGTLCLEDSPYLLPSGSPDLAKFRGRLYSDKPPVLAALGASVYLPLQQSGYRMFDLRSPRAFMESFQPVNRALVGILIAIPSGITLYSIRRMFQAIDLPRVFADFLSIGLSYGSLIFTYGVTFNNHSLAAGLITASFALTVLHQTADRMRIIRTVLVGLLASLAATIDLPAGGAFWLGLVIWVAVRSRRSLRAFLAGSAPMIILHCVLQSVVTGTPLPVEMYPEALAFEGSYWATEDGTNQETIPRIVFLVELLLGPQGWLTVTPVLFFLPIGLGAAILYRRDSLRGGAMLVLSVAFILLVYYSVLVRRTDYSGQSFGIRHLLPITPLVLFYAATALEILRAKVWRIAFVGLMFVGLLYSLSGVNNPWSRIENRKDPSIRLVQRFVIYPYSSYNR